MLPTLHICLLGDFQVLASGKSIQEIDTPRLQSLLAYLVLRHEAPQRRLQLASLFWPETTDAQALSNLRTLVHRLRMVLPHADTFLRSNRQELQWQLQEGCTLDVLEFEQALLQAEQTEDAQTICQTLTRATNIYRGDLLPGCYDEWAVALRDQLLQKFLDAQGRLVDLFEQQQNYPAAIKAARRLLHHDPLQETMYLRLMQLYAMSGDRAAALRTYHTCATILERELAVEPDHATRELYEQLVRKGPVARPASRTVARNRLIGRQQEWTRLLEAWQVASQGKPTFFVLSGEAGIGKTRMAEELLNWTGRQGLAQAAARCYASEEGQAYFPISAWLRSEAIQTNLMTLADIWLCEVARLVPDLLVKRPELAEAGPLTEGWQRQRFFEALAHAMLATRQPLLLFLDDVQWCDRETLDWLHFLLHFDQRMPLLILGTVRSEEVASDHPLVSFLHTLRRNSLVAEYQLTPLTATATAELARQVAGHDISQDAASQLYQETEGNPLFVVEGVRGGLLNHDQQPGQQVALLSGTSRLPATVRVVLATRLGQLSANARTMVNIASVIGRTFSFAVLAEASKSSEDMVVAALDELWQRRIIREQEREADTYDFSHDKLREEAYVSLGAARRRLLHGRVLKALQAQKASTALLAHHAHLSGAIELAWRYSTAAGDDARRLFAVRKAIEYYEQARHLPQSQDTLPLKTLQNLYAQLGRMYELNEEREKAQAIYTEMLTTARERHEPGMECAALNRLAMLAMWQSFDDVRALALFQEAQQVASSNNDEAGLAEAEWGLAQMYYYIFDGQKALYHAERALALARKHDLHDLCARSLNALAYGHQLLGDLEQNAICVKEASRLFAAAGNRAMEADCLTNFAHARIFSGAFQEGIDVTHQTYQISSEIGNTWGQAYSSTIRVFGLLEAGRLDEALEAAQHCINLTRQLGFVRLLYSGLIGVVFVQLFRGETEDAHKTLREFQALTEQITVSQRPVRTLASLFCMYYAMRGQWQQAYSYALQVQPDDQLRLSYFRQYSLIFEIAALLHGGNSEQATSYINTLSASYVGQNNPRFRMSLKHAAALLANWQGESEQVKTYQQEAETLAKTLGLRLYPDLTTLLPG